MAEPLWTLGEIAKAAAGTTLGAAATPVSGCSIDSRSLAPGDVFVAIRGPNRDGHAFVAAALEKGAACAIVDNSFPQGDEQRLVRVGDTLEALNGLGSAARARAKKHQNHCRHRQRGQDRHQGGVAPCARPERFGACLGQVVQQSLGVPLSLANMPKDTRFGVFELGMNHAGEIDALTRLRSPISPSSPRSRRSISATSARSRTSPTRRPRFSGGLEARGAAVINRDSPYFQRLKDHALARGATIVGFGEAPEADARLRRRARSRRVECERRDPRRDDRLPARRAGPSPGAELACRSRGGEAACADLASAADALAGLEAQPGGGAATSLRPSLRSRSSMSPTMPIRPRCAQRSPLSG